MKPDVLYAMGNGSVALRTEMQWFYAAIFDPKRKSLSIE